MKYKVRVTKTALNEMEEIYEYIATQLKEPLTVLKQYQRIANAITGLEEFPYRFSLVTFEPEKTMGLHRVVVDNYSVFYIIKEGEVTVTNILYSASDLEKRIQECKD